MVSLLSKSIVHRLEVARGPAMLVTNVVAHATHGASTTGGTISGVQGLSIESVGVCRVSILRVLILSQILRVAPAQGSGLVVGILGVVSNQILAAL